MNAFDIIGPIMVGPSSSHTAGAVRIGRVAGELLGETPRRAVIRFHGSFARTYRGHGTDKAIVAGLLGFLPDDGRIRDSLRLAGEAGLDCSFERIDLADAHPNTAMIDLEGASGRHMVVRGASVGGGAIVIEAINDLKVSFGGDYHTLVIAHRDTPGVVAAVADLLAGSRVNIASMKVFRSCRGGEAVMIIETDQAVDPALNRQIGQVSGVRSSAMIKPV